MTDGAKEDGSMFGAQKKEKETEKETELKWYHYLISLLFVVVGTVFIAYVEMDIHFICLFFTCVFAVAGIVSVLTYIFRDVETGYYRLDLVYGVMALFAALLFFTKQDVVEVYFPIIFGFILFANGVIKLQHSIDMKRIDRKMKKVTEMWLVVMIFALMCIAAGAVSVYLTPAENRTLFLFVGISLVVAGITDVFTHIVFNRKVKLFKSGNYVSDTKAEDEPEDKPENNPEMKAEEEIKEEQEPETEIPVETSFEEAGNEETETVDQLS